MTTRPTVDVSATRTRGVISFHRPGSCLPLWGRRPNVLTRVEALRQGYRPCKRCNP